MMSRVSDAALQRTCRRHVGLQPPGRRVPPLTPPAVAPSTPCSAAVSDASTDWEVVQTRLLRNRGDIER